MNLGAIVIVLLLGAVVGAAVAALLAPRLLSGSRVRRALIAAAPASVLTLAAGFGGAFFVMQTASAASMPGILAGVLGGAGLLGGFAAFVAGLFTALRMIRD